MVRDKYTVQETIVYVILWGLLFLAPLLNLYMRAAGSDALEFRWEEVFKVWREYGQLFALFLIHNFLLAPLLVYRQRRLLYVSIVSALVLLFTFYQCTSHPGDERRPGPDGFGPPMELRGDRRPPRPEGHPGDDPGTERPPLLPEQHNVVAVVLLVLMLLANLGIKLNFKSQRDQQRFSESERQSLHQQLEYLKYQLNPHFLMNTLNNIHALVDIDPERARAAIIQLSRILRYVLYESNGERVPMTRELEFMKSYTDLMRMRYGDKLRFTASEPSDVSAVNIPPLLFISFVENAFKHGVSYQKPSFIDVSGKHYRDVHGHDRLLWTCRNSRHQRPDATPIPREGGVGMANVRRRLDLIYGKDYTLGINTTDDTYEVILDIPLA